jgi:short-subunit dehydrogenase
VRTTLVTGASSGIGLEFARLFAKDGDRLILVARTAAKLEELAAELKGQAAEVIVLPADLSKPEAPREIFEKLAKDNVTVDILINNAGFAGSGAFAERKLQDELEQIQVNVTALTELTHRYLQQAAASGERRILNVASTAGFQPGPMMAVYYATKAYVLNFSEAIANELAERGITVTCLCPGPTLTNFQKHANVEGTPLFKYLPGMNAAGVARVGYDALKAGKPLVIAGFTNALLAFSVRFTPRWLITKISRMTTAST